MKSENIQARRRKGSTGTDSPLNVILTEMIESYGFSLDGVGRRIAGIWRGFPVMISIDGDDSIDSLVITMEVGEGYRVKDFRRAARISPVRAVHAFLSRRRRSLRFVALFRRRIMRDGSKVCGALRLLLDAAADCADLPPRTCGWCGERETDELTIDREVPRRMCGPCWEAYYFEYVEKQKQPPDYLQAMILGVFGALVTGMIWSFLMSREQYLLLFLFTPVVGAAVAWMVVKGAKRGDVWVYILAGTFSILAGAFGILLASVLRVHAALGIWDVQHALDDLLLQMSDNRGGPLFCVCSLLSLWSRRYR